MLGNLGSNLKHDDLTDLEIERIYDEMQCPALQIQRYLKNKFPTCIMLLQFPFLKHHREADLSYLDFRLFFIFWRCLKTIPQIQSHFLQSQKAVYWRI